MTDRSGVCGSGKVEGIWTFQLKNFSSFYWRWMLLTFIGSLLMGALGQRTLVMSPVGSMTLITLTGFAAWVWAWPKVIKRWRDRVFEDAMMGGETIEADYEEVEDRGLPMCPHCEKNIFPPIDVDTTTQCPHCNVLLYPLVYNPTEGD